MNHIKKILLFITLIFGFIMQAEVYQNMLWTFNSAYYLSSKYTIVNNNIDSFITDCQVIAQKHNISIFSTFNYRNSNNQTTLYIYGDNTIIRDSLKETMDIEEKTYTSLIGGITTVEIENFDDVKNTGNGQDITISYIGNEKDITAMYQELAQTYSLTQPKISELTENDMMIVVWGMLSILMIVLNVIDVFRRQKEVVVRVSLGESSVAIASKAAVADIISYVILFVLAKLFVSQFISGWYARKLILLVYCIGVILSIIPYIAFIRFDVRKAFSNASDKKGMFYVLNFLKVFATGMTIFTITTNLNSIQGNLFTSSKLLENYYKDYYFGVMTLGNHFEEELNISTENNANIFFGSDMDSAKSNFWNKIYENEYNTLNPIICIGSQIGDLGNYIFVNHNAEDMLQGFSDKLTEDDKNADIVVFIPEGKNVELYKNTAQEEIKSLTKDTGNLNIVYKVYSGREKFYYLNSNREETIDGLSRVTNPIVIYQANKDVALNGGYIETKTHNSEVIFSCDENTIREVAQKYAGQLGLHYFMLTNVEEDYTYSHNFLVKLVSFISSLCVLVFILDMVVIRSTVKIEFRLSSMKIALRKVLGYSFYERHKKFIIVTLIENCFIVVGICISSIFIHNLNTMIALLIGVLITIIEMVIIFINILDIEKTSISKALKGGCL